MPLDQLCPTTPIICPEQITLARCCWAAPVGIDHSGACCTDPRKQVKPCVVSFNLLSGQLKSSIGLCSKVKPIWGNAIVIHYQIYNSSGATHEYLNIWYQRLKHYYHESSNSAVRNGFFSVSIGCAIFSSQHHVQTFHTGFIQTFHILQNSEMVKKLYLKLCQNALRL